jgi:hypothetical protein
MATKYNYPYYPDADRETVFEEGLQFQDFVVDILLRELGIAVSNYSSRYYQYNFGENKQGIEIKLDRRISRTANGEFTNPDSGNVSIEVAEKSSSGKDGWTDSGIMRADNSWLYIQGNYDIVFIFGKMFLRQLYLTRYRDKVREVKPTLKTFLLPVPVAKKYALKVFIMVGGGK